MFNIVINLSFQLHSNFIYIICLLFSSLICLIHCSTTIMNVPCGTDVELTCPIYSIRKSNEIISWFRPNSSTNRLSFISIGDILLPEYASIERFNLISSSTISRLLINNILITDQGYYRCKSTHHGQHTIKLIVNSNPYLTPSSPLLLSPSNRTFSITCSFLCQSSIDLTKIQWLINDKDLFAEKYQFLLETLAFNSQRLTIFLNKKSHHFSSANFTCRYQERQSTILVRRRTREELLRLPRQEGSSSAYLHQTNYENSQSQCRFSWKEMFIFLLFAKLFSLCN